MEKRRLRVADSQHFQLYDSEDPRSTVEPVWSRVQVRVGAGVVVLSLDGKDADGRRSDPDLRE